MRKILALLALLIGVLIYYLCPKETAPRPLLSGPTTEASSKPNKKKSLPPTRVAPQAMQNAGGSDFEDDPPGELRLEGQVLDDEGNPVAGALVGVSSVPSKQITTDEKGWFFFEKLVSRTYYLDARKDNLFGSASSLLNESATPVTIRMQKGSSVELTVLDEISRAPIPNAEISWGWNVQLTANTDTDGKAIIRGLDRWAFFLVSAEGYGPQTVDAQPSANITEVSKKTVLLKKGAMVSGIVFGPSGDPVAKARISVEADQMWGLYDDDFHKIISDEEGKWSIPTLSAGTYRFSAHSEELATGFSEQTVLDGKTPKEGVEIRLEQGGVVTGKVVSANGDPIVGAVVRVTEDTEAWSRNFRRDYTDTEGKFKIKGMPLKPLTVGASSPDGEIATPQSVDLSSGTAEVTLTMDISGTIIGIVVDQDGAPIAEAEVSAFPASMMDDRKKWRMRSPVPTTSDPDGKFELKGVVADEDFSLSADFPGMSFGSWFDKDNVVKARAGDKNVKLVLKTLGKVKGRVQLKSGGTPKEFSVRVGYESSGNFTDKDNGEFLVEKVSPGKQTADVQGTSFKFKMTKQFEVKPGETLDIGTIILDGGRTVSGRVLAGGQPVANAVVVVGWVNGGGARLDEENEYNKRGRTLSREDGSFNVSGLDEDEELTTIAEHPTLGRSKGVKIEKKSGDQVVELILSEGGSLEGTLKRAGKPVEGYVSARDVEHSGGGFSVSSGLDGKFRFDFLVPGTYEITGQDNRFGMGKIASSKTVSVTIDAKKTAKVNIDIPSGVTLIVSPMQYGKLAPRALVQLVSKSISPKDTDEFYELIRDLPDDQVATGSLYNFIPGTALNPLTFTDMLPGTYTLCISQGPPQDVWQNMSEEEQKKPQPIQCQTQTVTATPAEQSVTINIPEWYPPETP